MCRGQENTFSREDMQTAKDPWKGTHKRNSNQNCLSKCLLLKRTQVTNLGENVEKRNPYDLLMRLQIGAATVENSMEGLQIIKYRTTMWSSHHISGCSLEINKIQKQPKSLAAAAAKSLQSCPTLCDPIDSSPPGSAVPGILQARTVEWVAISFSTAWKWKVKVKSLSRDQLVVTPWTIAHQAPPSMGFSKQEYWNGVSLPSPT